MYLIENPVLQRELLVNLRMKRGFVLMLVYQGLLAMLVYLAWPRDQRLDLSTRPEAARQLVDMFFLGQYLLASLMAPSFAAGAITGEKERRTYEMLLASPLRPAAIVLGKLLAALAYLGILVFSSLPIVMLCLPLGGVSPYEVLAAYLGLIASVVVYGTIGVACSSYFQRTAASLVVSYLIILPLAMTGVLFWYLARNAGEARLLVTITVIPAGAFFVSIVLFANTAARLLHPPDVGSEGKDVVDLETEAEHVVGLIIQRDQFPDKLFAPPKRDTLLEDGVNPVYDKEIRSEIFSQGTLMLRVVIQVSMLLAIPLMALCLYIWPQYAPWYIAYVILFNMLVGPVFSAGSVTSERERQTLDLLLTTAITPWQILSGKLWAGLRVSSVLTMFLMWPLLLATVMVDSYWTNIPAVLAFFLIICLTCLTTALLALFCSVLFQRTSVSMMASYLLLFVLFGAPVAALRFAEAFYPESSEVRFFTTATISSPFAAAFNVPLNMPVHEGRGVDFAPTLTWWPLAGYTSFALLLCGGLLLTMIWLFRRRWRVSAWQFSP